LGSREKKNYGYKQRDEAKRQIYLEQIATIHAKDIVYVDESGMDDRDDYAYGWNHRGQRFYALKSGRRQSRVNMIAALCNRQLLAPFTVAGACNRAVFETWLLTCLLPVLKPGQVVVIDNATFHKGGLIEQLIEQAGCKVLYLPPYSPDFNKIEKCWSWLKNRIRQCKSKFDCLRDAIEYVLKLAS
jgi:transposase